MHICMYMHIYIYIYIYMKQALQHISARALKIFQ